MSPIGLLQCPLVMECDPCETRVQGEYKAQNSERGYISFNYLSAFRMVCTAGRADLGRNVVSRCEAGRQRSMRSQPCFAAGRCSEAAWSSCVPRTRCSRQPSQQVVRLAQSISGATLRAHILVMMAEALTD
jgi:hypothetical protein